MSKEKKIDIIRQIENAEGAYGRKRESQRLFDVIDSQFVLSPEKRHIEPTQDAE